ncbi:hypothetical protein D0B54_03065 [Solimonas sp. K1W22B-7]|uniref:EF-hand domain-containing protein n=1 Tax=Solimonas sp. K1W22B-7 TaxID=2303331 RepID=UPI000E3330C8|nr:EF-hand domain-containing protein [Solimonas sp. K1W22B-7]AXQ27709.1 hypothetical protein D0B54_03065 [Solimonas sp. K1W22B-7]
MKTVSIVSVGLVFVAAAATSQQTAHGQGRIGGVAPADSATANPSRAPAASDPLAIPVPPPVVQPAPGAGQINRIPSGRSSSSISTPSAGVGTSGGAVGVGGASFLDLDINGDGRLMRGELRDPLLVSNFRQLDMNNDGALSAQEYGRFGTEPFLPR